MTYRLGIVALLLAAGCSTGSTPVRERSADRVAPGQGDVLYTTHCATCHGADGKGEGAAARYLFPKPRDFSLGKYKIRSTPTGQLPTDDDLLGVITNGMPGSAMPAFGFLSVAERASLVAFVKGLAKTQDGKSLWEVRGKPVPVTVGAQPAVTRELVALGAGAYRKMNCAACHGMGGEGDGPSAKTLRDDWGYPAPPNDFTRGIYKGGGTDKDIYLRFTTGMSGTPMPSFASELSDEERWALVAYVKSLAGAKVARQSREEKLTASRVAELPVIPFDPAWDKVAGLSLPLMLTWQRQERNDAVTVKAVHDGKAVAILMEWTDLTCDTFIIRAQDFADACAVQFALPGERGHFAMGEKGRPVNIWHWRMDRQMDVAKHLDMEDYYPGMVSDDYPMAGDDYGKPKEGWPPRHDITPAQSQDRAFLSGWAAGNLTSDPNKVTPMQDLNAIGFGTLELQKAGEQNVNGRGVWSMGRWKVVFIRSLEGAGAGDVKLAPGQTADVAFAVWDGTARDRDGQKLVTVWQKLELK